MLLCGNTARAGLPPEIELIRLHVIASDDSRPSQLLKLRVRDAVLSAAQVLLADCSTAEGAWLQLNEHLPALEAIARQAAGCEVTAETGTFPFPDRTYAGAKVPAGEYRALRIVIGPGEGRNWWCVLYPSLCLASEDGYYSLFGRWLETLFGGETE